MNVFYLNFIFLLRCFSNAQYHLAKEENVEKTRIIGEFANITFTYCLMKCKDTTKCRFVGTDTYLSSQPLIHCYLIKERALGSTTGTENTKRMNILEEVNISCFFYFLWIFLLEKTTMPWLCIKI